MKMVYPGIEKKESIIGTPQKRVYKVQGEISRKNLNHLGF